MQIYMLSTQRGSPEGFRINRYREAKHYCVPDTLGCKFVRNGWALEIPEEDNVPVEKVG